MKAGSFDPLVAAVVHDAKNALQALDTQLDAAQRRPASTDFAALRSNVGRIAAQLSELLTLYRAQNGQLRLAIDDHDLSDFIDDLLLELGPLPPGLALEVERAAALRVGAWAFDAYLVKLVLLDALRNALRHASGRVVLALDVPSHGGLCFSVSDDGPGYPASLLEETDSVGVASLSGTGLGLAFARLIAERHAVPDGRHGRVELTNLPGARLALMLP